MGKFHGEDMVGRRFGKLTVMEREGTNKHKQALWKCACSCGCLMNVRKPRLWKGDYTLTYNGKTQTVSEWAEEMGMNYFTLYRRLQRGWDVERALTK